MNRARVAALVAALVGVVAPSRVALAQRATDAAENGPTNVRSRAGLAVVQRLLRSPALDERLQGAERAASIGTPEAIAALAGAPEASTTARDGRFLLALARALAPFADTDRARSALVAIVSAPPPSSSTREAAPREPARPDPALAAHLDLARQTAAMAIAAGGGDKGTDALAAIARSEGPGQAPALAAFDAYPPRAAPFGAKTNLPASALERVAAGGDLRALAALHAAVRSQEPRARAEALRALANAGDARVLAVARTSLAERDVRLRVAAAEALVTLGAPETPAVVAALLADDVTAQAGAELAGRAPAAALLDALIALAHAPQDERALAAIHALGRSPDARAVRALGGDLATGRFAYAAVHALARSPAPAAGDALVALARAPATRGLALRAYVVRGFERDVRIGALDDLATSLSRASAPAERALGVFVTVALGGGDLERALDDAAPAVRRAAVMAAGAAAGSDAILGRHLAKETDPAIRTLLGAMPKPEPVTADRPLLAEQDPLVRAHRARALAQADTPGAASVLAEAYADETVPFVREAIVSALALRRNDAGAPTRETTLALAARLDPDARVRRAARPDARVARSRAVPHALWLTATTRPGDAPWLGTLVPSAGPPRAFAFDGDGHAVVLGVAPGPARVVLAPRLPAYEASAP